MKEILFTSSILIPVILLLRALLGKKISMRLRYALWLLVALRLLLPVQFGHSSLSVQNAMQSNPTKEQPFVVISRGDAVPNEQLYQPSEAQEEINYKALAYSVWYVGIGAMALWIIAVNLTFYVKARKGAARLTLPNIPLRVYVTQGVPSPCLMGTHIFLTPEIAADESKRTHVLAHEMTHFYHGDSLWSIVRAVCLCVYWFHPLVWCAAILSKRDCELACDEGAIKHLGESERYCYGRTLISVAAQASKVPILHTATTMSQTKKQLSERIKAIAAKQKCPIAVVVVLCLILSLTAICTFTGRAFEKVEDTQLDQPIAEQAIADSFAEDFMLMPESTYHSPLQTEMKHETDTVENSSEESSEEEPHESTIEVTYSPNSQTPQITYFEFCRGDYLGEFTLQVGDHMEFFLRLQQHTKLRLSDSKKADAQLNPPSIQNYFAPQNYRLYVHAKKEGTIDVYFSDITGEYLAATVHVVAVGSTDWTQEEDSRGVVIPSFLIP